MNIKIKTNDELLDLVREIEKLHAFQLLYRIDELKEILQELHSRDKRFCIGEWSYLTYTNPNANYSDYLKYVEGNRSKLEQIEEKQSKTK